MYTKNEAIALAKTAKGENKMMNDERAEESDEFPPLSKLKQQNRKRQTKTDEEVALGVQEIVPLQHAHQRHIHAQQSDDGEQ